MSEFCLANTKKKSQTNKQPNPKHPNTKQTEKPPQIMANQIEHINLIIPVIPDVSWKSGLDGVFHTCCKHFIIETK